MLPIVMDADIVDSLFTDMYANEGYQLTVDLALQQVIRPNGDIVTFDVEPFRKHCLLNGLDDIGLTLQNADTIKIYEQQRRQQSPWLFDVISK
jgi:3-isopropylmalate/(R)-2-methylmalate dehydratase small subunit